jgi:hypothetical protein
MTPEDWNDVVKIALGVVLGAAISLAWDRAETMNTGNAAEWVTGLATAGLIGMAAWQLYQQTLQQRRWTTLQVCDRYDSDERIREALLILRRLSAGEQVPQTGHEIAIAVTTLFNYFDAVAIGLEQNLYVGVIVDQHLKTIVLRRYHELQNAHHHVLDEFRINFDQHYESLIRLMDKWAQ